MHSPGPSCKWRLISGQQVWRRGISHGGVAKSIFPVHPGQEPCRGSHSQLQPVFFSIPLSLYYHSLIYFTYSQALHSSANIVQPCPAEQPILRAEPRSNHPISGPLFGLFSRGCDATLLLDLLIFLLLFSSFSLHISSSPSSSLLRKPLNLNHSSITTPESTAQAVPAQNPHRHHVFHLYIPYPENPGRCPNGRGSGPCQARQPDHCPDSLPRCRCSRWCVRRRGRSPVRLGEGAVADGAEWCLFGRDGCG